MTSVIVFGPTGNVGSIAARTAQEHGAKVFLAMRDPQKNIPGLSAEEEKAGGFERVQADLTKPGTVTEAIQKTGAKRAFIYLAHGTSDHMKATITALKSAGIEFIIFLSSYTVHGDLHAYTPDQIIPFVHSRVEITLDEVYGPENYVALRPGGFVTNLMQFKKGIDAGEVSIYGPSYEFDCITPGDMGSVSGTILVQGPKEGQQKVYLYGPKNISQKDAVTTIGKVLGKELKITEPTAQEATENYLKSGMPKPIVDYMVHNLGKPYDSGLAHRPNLEEGVKNVELYTGRPSTGLEEWTEANKHLFNA